MPLDERILLLILGMLMLEWELKLSCTRRVISVGAAVFGRLLIESPLRRRTKLEMLSERADRGRSEKT